MRGSLVVPSFSLGEHLYFWWISCAVEKASMKRHVFSEDASCEGRGVSHRHSASNTMASSFLLSAAGEAENMDAPRLA